MSLPPCRGAGSADLSDARAARADAPQDGEDDHGGMTTMGEERKGQEDEHVVVDETLKMMSLTVEVDDHCNYDESDAKEEV